jgi:hypothetical protein
MGELGMRKCFYLLVLLFYNNIYNLFAQDISDMLVEEKMEIGLQWIFEKGLGKYLSGINSRELFKELNAETSSFFQGEIFQLREPPDFTNLCFDIQNGGRTRRDMAYRAGKGRNAVTMELWRAKRYVVDIQSDVIEYWIIEQIYANNGTNIGCLFIITSAETMTSSRNVVLCSDQYISSAFISNRQINFPEDNLAMLSLLNAKRWPSHYKNSDLSEYEILYDSNGVRYKQRINAERRKYWDSYYNVPPKLSWPEFK